MSAHSIQEGARKALQVLGSLEARPKIDDWGTNVLFVYETLWEALEHDLVAATELDTLVRLLDDADTLALARNVIPELRDAREAAKLTLEPKIKFIERVQAMTTPPQTLQSSAADSAMYKAEKDALFDADAYRTMLFLRRTERFSDEELDDIREWLDKCPVKGLKDKGAEVHDP